MYLAFFNPVDMGLIMVVALLVFGPKRMPEVAKQVGGFVRELRKTMGQFTEVLDGVKGDVGAHVDAFPKFDQAHLLGTEQLMRPYDQPTEQEAPMNDSYVSQGLSLSTLPPRVSGEDPAIRSTIESEARI